MTVVASARTTAVRLRHRRLTTPVTGRGRRYAERSPRRDLGLRPLTRADVAGGSARRTTRATRPRCWPTCRPTPFRVVLRTSPATGARSTRFPPGRGARPSRTTTRTIVTVSGDRMLAAAAQRTRRRERAHLGARGRHVAAGLRLDHGGATPTASRRGLATARVRRRGLHAGFVKAAWPMAGCQGAGCARGCRPKTTSSPNAEPRPLPSMPHGQQLGTPGPASRRPLNSTPLPSGSHAGSAA